MLRLHEKKQLRDVLKQARNAIAKAAAKRDLAAAVAKLLTEIERPNVNKRALGTAANQMSRAALVLLDGCGASGCLVSCPTG